MFESGEYPRRNYMTRNLIILGCAALLAIGLSVGAFAGSIADEDSDGVPDSMDKCTGLANGPLDDPTGCGQLDPDQDGYAVPCDADQTNNGVVDSPDLGVVLSALGTADANADLTCNGVVDSPDLGITLSALGLAPGPSGLACAGTVPCEN
jgi:hypothetical protein